MFESDLEDISRHFRRSVPENNATECAIPFRAVPWNNGNHWKSRFLLNKQPDFVIEHVLLLTSSHQCCVGSLSSEALTIDNIPPYALLEQ